jgi:predicted TIM-barrel fold metal-dependent hydrolase
MFNATDIPVNGFVHHVALHDGLMSGPLADLAVRLVSGAPGFSQDQARLAGLVGPGQALAAAVPAATGTGAGVRLEAGFVAQVHQAVADLSDDDLALIQREQPGRRPAQAIAPEAVAPELAEAFLLDTPVRFVRWAKLFCQSRLDLATLYYRFFSGAVDLAIPMLVDLASGLQDNAETTLAQQIELFDMLSRASMRGLIPGAPQLRIHPFVGFDPKRALDDGTTVALVQDAVLNKGFVGVKVYPEMGWNPYQNTAANVGTAERAQALDAILAGFFGWCTDKQVPVTAHCNHSNYPDKNSLAANYGSPESWLSVLAAHPRLRLNLGHFGGAYDDPSSYTWTWTIAKGMAEFDALYADVGCHHADDAALMGVHFGVLQRIAAAKPVMRDRLMFGTDWYMEANNPNPNAFLTEYQSRYQAAFGAAPAAKFMSGNALRFLGFGGGELTANGDRLRKRYRDVGVAPPSWLGSGAG